MPWCSPCERFFNPNSLQADGRCPACGESVGGASHASHAKAVKEGASGASVEAPAAGLAPAEKASAELEKKGAAVEAPSTEEPARQSIPWHFWLLLAATAGYLIWRFVQLIARLFGA